MPPSERRHGERHTHPDVDFDALCRTDAALFAVPVVIVSLLDGDGGWTVAGGDRDAHAATDDLDAFCARVAYADEAVVEDGLNGSHLAVEAGALDTTSPCFRAGAPIGAGDGDRAGALILLDVRSRALFSEQRRQLQDLASVVAAQVRLLGGERLAREREALMSAEIRGLKVAEGWSRVGHWRIALPDERIMWSDGMYAIFGRDPRLGPPAKDAVLDVFHPDDREEARLRLERTAQGLDDYEHRLRLIRTDGEVWTVLAHAFPEYDRCGGIVGLFGLCQDVTDLVRSEEGARETGDMLRATIENMSQCLIVYGPDLRVRLHNRRALELLDLPEVVLREGNPYEVVNAYQTARGEFRTSATRVREALEAADFASLPDLYERLRPDGTCLEVRVVRLAGGGYLRTYTDITERQAVERRIAHMALHDDLTGLPNRTLFRERLEQRHAEAERNGTGFAVLACDLDGFKGVNDRYGHPIGDLLLQAVAERLRSAVREGDTVARLGGDEFAIILASLDRPRVADRVARRVIAALSDPFDLDGRTASISVSIGVVVGPREGVDADGLFKRADRALYRAKAAGRNTHRFDDVGSAGEIADRDGSPGEWHAAPPLLRPTRRPSAR